MKKILGLIFGLLFLIFLPLTDGHTSLVNGNHLVAFYNPWAGSAELGWGVQVPQKPVGVDDLGIFYPQRIFTTEALRTFGEIPFWNPLNYSGNHHAGLSETAVFYPLNLLFFVLPQMVAWNILIIIQPVLIGLGMYLFMRRIVKNALPAVFAAFVFATSTLVFVRMIEGLSVGHTLLWLPFALWAVESHVQTGRLRYPVILTVVLVFSLTGGWVQYTAYIVFVGLAYTLWRLRYQQKNDRCRGKTLPLIILPFIVFPLFALYHVIPALSAFAESPRAIAVDIGQMLLNLVPFQHLVTFLFPDFWGNPATFNYFGRVPYKESLVSIGIIPFVFALVGLKIHWRNPFVRFFTGTIAISLLLATDNPVSRFVVSLPIPILSTFIPVRILVLATLGLSVLAGYGIGAIAENTKTQRSMIFRYALAIFLVCITVLVLLWGTHVLTGTNGLPQTIKTLALAQNADQIRIEARNALLPTGLVGVFIVGWVLFSGRRRRWIVFIVWTITAVQIWYGANKFFPFSKTAYIFPNHPLFSELQQTLGFNRFVTLGSAHIPPNIPLAYNLASPEGASAMYVARFGELVSYVTDPQRRTDFLVRIGVDFRPETVPLLTGRDPLMQRFLEVSGVRYLVSLDSDNVTPAEVISNFNLLWQSGHWQVWEDTRTLPRTFVTGDFSVKKEKDRILTDMFMKENKLRHITIEEDPGFHEDPAAQGSASIVSYTPNTITIMATSDRPALVYLSDTQSRAFRATVDGKETQIIRANYAFRAVPISPGTHTIVMRYSTELWVWGTGISVILWVVSGTLCFVVVKKGRMSW